MRYYSFNSYLRQKYGSRVHRLSLDAGFSCPVRDGALGTRGCIYCNDKAFSVFAGRNKPLEEQIEESMKFAKERYEAEKFIAYFQNATGTYAPAEDLKRAYDTIKDFRDIVGLSISTRPDCISDDKLSLIGSYADDYEVWIEYGLQTVHDKTLSLLGRRHTASQSVEAVEKTAKSGIRVGVHVILGLPGESREDMVETARSLSKLPVQGVKLHMLHVLKDTELENLYNQGKIKLLKEDEYVSIACDFLENLRSDCVILRLVSDAHKDFLVAPDWINSKSRVIKEIEQELAVRDSRQGISLPDCRYTI